MNTLIYFWIFFNLWIFILTKNFFKKKEENMREELGDYEEEF